MLSALDQSAFSTWLLSSNSIWAYPTVLTLHTFGMMVLVGSALMIDLRLLGFGRAIPISSLERLFRVMWSAFWLNLVTGTMLFIADASKRATQPLFLIKLLLVAAGIATIVLLRRRVFDGAKEPLVIGGATKRLAVTSLLVWSAAVTAGRLLAYVG
jgi:Family of unknown function (DUF6644)